MYKGGGALRIYHFYLALVRAMRTVYFPVMIAVFAVAVYFAPTLGGDESIRPAAICDLDGSEISERVTDTLRDYGFETCDSEELMRERIASGQYDCGAILPRGFGDRLAKSDLGGAVDFIVTPTSYADDMYRNYITAAVYTEYAPYITYDALRETELTKGEVLQAYRDRLEAGILFSFDIESTDENVTVSAERPRTYTLAAVAFLVFAIMTYTVCDVLKGDIASISGRLGAGRVMILSVIPTLIVRVAFVILAYGIAAYIRSAVQNDEMLAELFLAVAGYAVSVTAFALFLATLLGDSGRIEIVSFYILILSLILCPVYMDLAALVPVLGRVRLFAPPYWMWLFANGEISPLVSLAALIPATLAFYLRSRKRRGKTGT